MAKTLKELYKELEEAALKVYQAQNRKDMEAIGKALGEREKVYEKIFNNRKWSWRKSQVILAECRQHDKKGWERAQAELMK